jgi:hypothetical protein
MRNTPLPIIQAQDAMNRRTFLKQSAAGIGMAALGSLLGEAWGATSTNAQLSSLGLPGLPHFAPKAKRVIYLFQAGAPSQLDLFDYKPNLYKHRGQDLPASIRMGQRLTGMTSGQKTFPVANSIFKFDRYGKNGTWVSELLPHTLRDQVAVYRSDQPRPRRDVLPVRLADRRPARDRFVV